MQSQSDMISQQAEQIKELIKERNQLLQENSKLTDEILRTRFGYQSIMMSKDSKNTMKFYTGLFPDRFLALYRFLTNGGEVRYSDNRFELSCHSGIDHLLLTLARLRRNFQLADLSHRYQLSTKTVSIIFNAWINHMYNFMTTISIWPHRDIIFQNSPSAVIRDFPGTIIIIDCTEIKTQTPSSLLIQSQ